MRDNDNSGEELAVPFVPKKNSDSSKAYKEYQLRIQNIVSNPVNSLNACRELLWGSCVYWIRDECSLTKLLTSLLLSSPQWAS